MSVDTSRAGQTIECLAAVALTAKADLSIVTVLVDPPKPRECRIKMVATAICHTDHYTLSGQDPEGLFPSILGHEGAGIVESVGSEVTSVKPGDSVICLYTPECRECAFCKSSKTNLCVAIRATQGKGLMPDSTSRFRLKSTGESLFHYMGCSTFSQYTVMPEIALCKVSSNTPLDKASLFGCGVTTGLGAVTKTAKVEAGSSVAVFGLGAVGLSVIQGARLVNAKMIIAIDINSEKEEIARKMGATHFVNPRELPDGQTIVQALQKLSETGFGIDYTFECIGNVKVMRDALESAARGWGVSCVIGVAGSGQEIATRPFQLVTGRTWKGTAFGGVKSRSELPEIIDQFMQGKIEVDSMITHRMKLEDINEGFHLLEQGKSLRTVIEF